MSRVRTVAGLVAVVAGCEIVGGLGAIASSRGITTWYPMLRKPRFTPPGWVFGPVWTLLYAAMGTAAFMIARRRPTHPEARRALGLFVLQLSLNALWSPAFFGRRSAALGLADIAALWASLVATLVAFARISRPAALLMLPYLAWTSFAALLNAAIWRLNR